MLLLSSVPFLRAQEAVPDLRDSPSAIAAVPGVAWADDVRMLSPDDVRALVRHPYPPEPGPQVDGLLLTLSDADVRSLIRATFEKNGITLETRTDGCCPNGTRIGFRYGVRGGEFLLLEWLRGGPAILLLPELDFVYEVGSPGPNSAADAIDRLLEDARRFLVWLQIERNRTGGEASLQKSAREEIPMNRLPTLLLLAALAVPARADHVDDLVTALGSEDWADRENATSELTKMGAQAVPYLEKAASGHEDLEVRHRAKKILDSFVYSNPDFLMSFAALGDEALPRITEIVGRADPAECAAAADVLGRIGTPGAFDLLGKLVAHASPIVRARTATALDRFEDSRATEILRTLATAGEDPTAPDRLAAQMALARRGDDAAVTALFAALAIDDLRVRQTAASGLALAFARGGREDEAAERIRNGTDEFVRRLSVGLLARSASKKGAGILMATASNPQYPEPVRGEALRTLGAPGFPDGAKFLAEFGRHRGGALAAVAAESLVRLDKAAGIEILETLAKSGNDAAREALLRVKGE